MAAELIENPSTPHTPEHDLESMFWVLLWITLLYTKTSWDIRRRSSVLADIMNLKVYQAGGGISKLIFISNFTSVEGLFSKGSPGLYVLIDGIHGILSRRYYEKMRSEFREMKEKMLDMDSDEIMDESMDESTNNCTDEAGITMQSGNAVPPDPEDLYATVLDVFEKALLKQSKWSETDRAVRQTLEMPSETKSAAQSGPKRSREMLEQSCGATLPPPKRFES